MASFNKVILMGNLTRDPEVRYTPNQTAVADIALAVNHYWFDKASNQKKEETSYIDVTLWGRQAEVAGEYLSKGRSVLIEGRLKLDQWDDKETGKKRSKLKVICENMTMIGGRPSGGGGGAPAPQASAPQPHSESAPSSVDSYYENPPADIPDDPANIPDDEVPF